MVTGRIRVAASISDFFLRAKKKKKKLTSADKSRCGWWGACVLNRIAGKNSLKVAVELKKK